ncbi:hypothetical protein C8Q79DRAFT_904310 [Trametes meyenii]|nr:hypothetical protein C8Q79DRAFT_904310 [Trametes meyenii]
MKQDSGTSKFHPSTIATARQVRGFLPSEGRCCDVSHFCLQLGFTSAGKAATPGSEWNQSATRVFVDDFIRCGYACQDHAKITTMFQRHFRTIQRHYQRLSNGSMPADVGPSDDDKVHSKYQRRYTLFQRRYKTCLWYTATQRHIRILQRLGVDGMSSDEEDTASPFPCYHVSHKPWRAHAVTRFLRVLDALYRRRRSRQGQGSRRGAQPRLRFQSSNVSSQATAVHGLPRNAYDSNWLTARTAVEIEDLNIDETQYDFSHHADVLS